MVHYSESKRLHEGNDKIKVQAHSDYINELPNSYGNDIDVMVEAKAKELSILPYINSNNFTPKYTQNYINTLNYSNINSNNIK